MNNTLEKICADKHNWIAAQKKIKPIDEIKAMARDADCIRGFIAQLESAYQQQGFGVIAEIKKASPSKGLIREDFNPDLLAKNYTSGGATCLSVLTDEAYFQGSDQHFSIARQACSLPMIRKDFILEPYQIHESRALGADCILIILAALSDTKAEELLGLTWEMGMDALIEVHDKTELLRAIKLNSLHQQTIIGINNRNLKTLEVDTNTCLKLSNNLTKNWWVAESGITDATTMKSMINAGAGAFLIGESLMRQHDVTQALANLLKEARQ